MPNVGRPCKVCQLPNAVRGPLEAAHLVGESVRSIARAYAGAGLSEAGVRRHLAGGHASRNVFRPSDVGDDFSLGDTLAGTSRGLQQLHAIRDESFRTRNTATMVRAAAEANRAFETLTKLGFITEEKVTNDLADLRTYRGAVVAMAKRFPDLTEQYAAAMAEGGNKHEQEVAEQLLQLVESIRTTNKGKK